MTVEVAQLASYLESFTALVKETEATTPPWLRVLRETAFARFCAVGFPTTHDEDWRFTNISALVRAPFRRARKSAIAFTVSDLAAWRMKGAAARMVFLDGCFAPNLSTWGALPKGVTVGGLNKTITNRPDIVADHLGRYLNI